MTVLLTDTGSVFGHALALEYLNTGAHIFGISQRPNYQLNKFANYYHLTQDIKKFDELTEKFNNFLGHVKVFDLVILNADIQPEKNEIKKTPVAKITNALQVNVLANKVIIDSLLMNTSAIHQIVAISSDASVSRARRWNTYALSKTALNTLIKLYAREVPETHFSALDPGMTEREVYVSDSGLPDNSKHPVSKRLKGVNNKGNIPDPIYAANYMVEAMGIALQEESGSYKDVREMFFSPELSH